MTIECCDRRTDSPVNNSDKMKSVNPHHSKAGETNERFMIPSVGGPEEVDGLDSSL